MSPSRTAPLFSSPGKPGLIRPEGLILVLWALLNGFFLARHGLVTTGEAAKYIEQARLFTDTGRLSSPNFYFYFIQIALLSLCMKLHLGFAFALAVQLFFNLAALLYFFKTLAVLFDPGMVALAGALLLLLNIPYQEFNVYLQTESLFQSFSLLLSCYVLRTRSISTRSLGVLLPLLLILCLTRPIGLLYLPATFLYFFFLTMKKAGAWKKGIFLTGAAVLSLYILDRALGSGGEFDFLLPFREEHIICGSPTLPDPGPVTVTGNGNSIYGLFYYVLHHFGQFVRLAVLRSLAFWGLYRSYYSIPHNLFLCTYFFSICGMVLYGFFYRRRELTPERWLYPSALILLTWIMVMLTCDDWHNRVYLSISPYLILLSLPALRSRLINASGTFFHTRY